MTPRKDITLDKKAVARAIRRHLEAFYKAASPHGYYDDQDSLEEDEDLFKAIFKSKYVSQHLDWLYVLEIIYAVVKHCDPLSPDQFADKLEQAISETAGQRDYLAIVPVAFKPPFGLLNKKKSPLRHPLTIGDITFSPPSPTARAVNNILAAHKFPEISEADFSHAARQSNDAFSHEILVTFKTHGAQDRLRFTVEIQSRTLCRLLEVFATLFGDVRPGFGQSRAVNHFFLLSKASGDLRRFPIAKPMTLDFELSAGLLKAIKRPEFGEFLTKLTRSNDKMYGRLRNAVKFFSMASNADDDVTSFLFYMISLESIFSKDHHAPIKSTLADLASLLCFPPDQRSDAHSILKESYDIRSKIVHSGVTSVERTKVHEARLIAARAIYCSLFLCTELKADNAKLDELFFNHLLDRKLGVAKALAPRVIWALPPITVKDSSTVM